MCYSTLVQSKLNVDALICNLWNVSGAKHPLYFTGVSSIVSGQHGRLLEFVVPSVSQAKQEYPVYSGL